MAFSLFVNAAKGLSSLQLSRNLGLHAKTAFVLLHKLRCALTSNSAATILSGVVEIDGGWFALCALVGATPNQGYPSSMLSMLIHVLRPPSTVSMRGCRCPHQNPGA
jgi:hypothetical protein